MGSMAKPLSSPFNPTSLLHPLDDDGPKAEERRRMENEATTVDLAKRLFELQAQSDRLKEENRRLVARNMVLEEQFRDQRRSSEDKDELIIKLKEEVVAMKGIEERLKEKYQKLREELESGERKWREEAEKIGEKYWKLEVEKRKLEIDLEAARRAVDGGDEVVEKRKAVEAELEGLKSLLKDEEGTIRALMRKNELLEREKMNIEEELGERVLKMEEAVEKWMLISSGSRETKDAKVEKGFALSGDVETGMDNFGCNAQVKGNGDLQNSGPKSVDVSHTEPQKESLEAGLQLKGHNGKVLGFKALDLQKKVSSAGKLAGCNFVQISDDEEDDIQISYSELKAKPTSSEDSSGTNIFHGSNDQYVGVSAKCRTKELKTPIKEGKKHSPSAASPSTAKRRKIEALRCSIEMQAGTKRCKRDSPTDGKLWETAEKMFNAFTTNGELCMESICALYRKHKSLGVWKNCLTSYFVGNRGFKSAYDTRGIALAELLTGGDPGGRLTKSLAEFEREDPSGLEQCRLIARHHYKELFEIYKGNLDPLFAPRI